METRALLRQVLIDLESDSARVDILYTDYAVKSGAIQRLLLASENAPDVSNDSLGMWFKSTLRFRRFFQSSSTYESIVATNHL